MMATAVKKTNWFAIWTSVAVVAVIAVVIVVVAMMNNAATDPGTPPSGAGVDQESGAIVFGEGEQTLDVYLDFMCPACGNFERSYGEEIRSLVDDGTITLRIHPISILDVQSQGTQFSTRAANIMYCVADAEPDAAFTYMQTVFDNQPDEGTPGLSDEELLGMAESSGATGVDTCASDGEYFDYVTAMTKNTPIQPGNAGIATPTLEVNGEVISNRDIPAVGSLATLFD